MARPQIPPLARTASGSGLPDTDGAQVKKRTSRFNIRSEADEGLPPKPVGSGIVRAQSAANVHREADLQERRNATPGHSSVRVESVLPHLEMMLKVGAS